MALTEIHVPDIGDFDEIEVIEVLVSKGDTIAEEDSLITLESDKASMEIPSPAAGTVADVKVRVGDRVSEGALIMMLDAGEAELAPPPREEPKKPEAAAQTAAPAAQPERKPEPPKPSPTAALEPINEASFSRAHASPAIRRFARELGVDLGQVKGTGSKSRILKEDVQGFVKQALARPASAGAGLGVAPMPEIDFSQFGPIETQALTKINKLTGQFLHRNWVTIPHVTQFDEADITNLEDFRKQLNAENKDSGVKVTPLAFIMKAIVAGLKAYPRFNSSLDSTGENLIVKQYYHVGVAVDTPDGLVVPVIRDVDQKSVVELSKELRELAGKAREKKLKPGDMQGGCISISSLGGIGGTKFTPIVNAPEVAILGVSKSEMKPVWNGKEFEPRLMLPLSLSYDHRVIDGALGARFTTYLNQVLSDIRRLLL
jgi:pyruvate dehydrogenase E2 component (dihydrolipoamide acetyltransferase)